MSRPLVSVRRVSTANEPAFVCLWTQCLVDGGVSEEMAARAAAEGRVSTVLARPDVRGYLATADGEAVGFILMAQSPFSGLVDAPTVTVDQLYVTKEARRGGVAKQLLGAATAYADSLGCEQVVSNVPVHDREANRFFARLGFSGQVVRRVVGTNVLRRRLSGDQPRNALDALLHQRRRSLRPRTEPASHTIAS